MFGLEGLKGYIGETTLEDAMLQFLLDAYLKKVGSLIGKDLELSAYEETLKGDGQQCIYLEKTPVFDILHLETVEDGELLEHQYERVDNRVYKSNGCWQGRYTTIGMSDIKYSSMENIYVVYRAGYLTEKVLKELEENGVNISHLEPNFPEDLELLIYESIKNHIQNGGKELKSYAIDDIRYEYVTMAETFQQVLERYKK